MYSNKISWQITSYFPGFQAVEMSEASPAWQLYTVQMDALVLMALKSSILTSLDAMYRTVAGIDGDGEDVQQDVRAPYYIFPCLM